MEAKEESRVYRVEAFIIPKANCADNTYLDMNEIDVKFCSKLKLKTTQLIEQVEKEKHVLLIKPNNTDNPHLEHIQTQSPESTESLNFSDSSKKDSINSFNEYQEEPDFETLIKSPELRESYSNQIEGDEMKPPTNGQIRIFSGLKKCLAEFLVEEQKEKINKESFIRKREEEHNIILMINDTKKHEFPGTKAEEIRIQDGEIDKSKIQIQKIKDKKEIQANEIKERKLKEPTTSKFTGFHKALKLEDSIYDEPFVGNFNRDMKNSKHILGPECITNVKSQGDNCIAPKISRRCNSLKSIDEGVEILDTNFEDICYHGHKNGCTVAIQIPEDVSQDIFKDNWMQRLEMLRQKETLLRDKEIALQSRERLLFKKEKELRILERMVKDKMKQAELYLKRCKNSPSLENVFDEKNIDSRSSDGSGGSKAGFILKVENTDKQVPFGGEGLWLKASELKYGMPTENFKNPPPTKSLFTTLPSDLNYESKFNAYSSFRCKSKLKAFHDDLDSTLSADVGDASYVVTSRKFDPVVFKKPAAFSRSASERKPKTECTNVISKEKYLKEYPVADFKENKIIRKVNENILVSQDKDTKYQDYGIIDKNVNTLDSKLVKYNEEEKTYGYLNLELDTKTKRKNSKGLKNRPISWSAETDNWLQKKREAFNTANQKRVNNLDKENLELNLKGIKYTTLKKKCGKGKKFSIFR